MTIKSPPEFRAEAVRIALTSGLTRQQVADDLGIGLSTLGKWVASHKHIELMSGPHDDKDKEFPRRLWPSNTCLCERNLGLDSVLSSLAIRRTCRPGNISHE